jgi:hypothetical protein
MSSLIIGQDVRLPARQTFSQGEVDACFSCAIATALEGRSLDVPELAAAFHLYHAYGGSPAAGGLTLTDAQSAQTRYGICRKSLYSYDVGDGTPSEAPNDDAESDARRRRTLSDAEGEWTFRRLAGLHRPREWQTALSQGLPVLIRIWLNPGYWAMRTQTQEAVWSDTSNPGNQNHAVVVLGYQSAQKRFIVQDSRGTAFANQGQWFLTETQATLGPITDAYVLSVPIGSLL